MVAIIKAGTNSISTIKRLAYLTWLVTYKEIITAEQINYMLRLFYDERALLQQLEQGHQFILALEDNEALGFASYSIKENDPSIYKLHKLYVNPHQQGKGIGRLLLNYCINDIKTKSAIMFQLNVNRNNKPAFNFYIKNGFDVIGEEDIDIGDGYFMNDYILSRQL